MKHITPFVAALFWAAASLNAQVTLSYDMLRPEHYELKAEVQDSTTREALGFASLYMQPVGDTLITHFTLTGPDGKAKLKEITRGEYVVTAEFMGYYPWRKQLYIRENRDLGIIRMQQNKELLEAAKVSAIANPLEIRQDTLIYNAAAFKVMEGDVLADLLKKMPGIEVSSDGQIKVNGESVDKITVGGKTFFSGDRSAALNYLPAKVVDKVQVINKESDAAAFSGIADEKKEKVMDVVLKEEYKEGFFGNVRLSGGTSIPGKEEKPYVSYQPLLYNGSGMISSYSEKDQLTAVLSGMNAYDENTVRVFASGDTDLDLIRGNPRSAQAGVNYNTERIKGMEINAAASFNDAHSDVLSHSDRTTFQEAASDVRSVSDRSTVTTQDGFQMNMEIRNKDRKKWAFTFEPKVRYTIKDKASQTESVTSADAASLNSSDALTFSNMRTFSTDGDLTLGVKDLGKKRRSLTITGTYSFQKGKGTSGDSSMTEFADGRAPEIRNLQYADTDDSYRFGGSLQYVEPFGDEWAVQTYVSSFFRHSISARDATQDGAPSSWYSAINENDYLSNYARLLLQYKKGRRNIQAGGSVRAITNTIHARSYNIDTYTGEGEVQWNFAPFIRYRNSWEKDKRNVSININYNGNSQKPSMSSQLPTFNLSNPTRISAGNIYLKPYFNHTLYIDLDTGDNAAGTNLNIYFSGGIGFNGEVQAGWFDGSGVWYSLPVNAKKPSLNIWTTVDYGFPLGKEEKLRFSLEPYFSYSRSTSYQMAGTGPSPDLGTLDYGSFISDVYGDASGSRFYSGASGFRESLTSSIVPVLTMDMTYKPTENLTVRASTSGEYHSTLYSVNPDANVSYWGVRASVKADWSIPDVLDISANVGYSMQRGLGEGFDNDIVGTALKISKSVKSWTFSLKASDLLDQYRHIITSRNANYSENSWTLTPGRYVLLGVSWNFGKMNASHQRAARDAMWRMM